VAKYSPKFAGARRYLWVFLPVILMLALTVAMELLASTSEDAWAKGVLVGAFGFFGLLVILSAVRWIAFRLKISAPKITVWRGVVMGLAVGLLISITCGLLFRLLHAEPATVTFGAAIKPESFLQNLGPALIEEASMRAGVVHLLNGLSGPWAGLAGGSLPFGLLHIFGRIFGNPVGVAHVIGTTASGLLLSILYLRFGFWAAFACHWIWNSLAGAWVRYAGITSRDGMQLFEGSPETVIVLVIACAVLFALPDKRWLRPQSKE
jgi:membrane protease YdiL (CAAX protease family)